MKHSQYVGGLVFSAIFVVIFAGVGLIVMRYAWSRRRDKGHSQKLTRRAAWLGGLFIALAPLCLAISLWTTTPTSPLHIRNVAAERALEIGLFAVIAVLLVGTIACLALVMQALKVEGREREAMQELRQPYRGEGPDHGN